jgi:hypothetical protein
MVGPFSCQPRGATDDSGASEGHLRGRWWFGKSRRSYAMCARFVASCAGKAAAKGWMRVAVLIVRHGLLPVSGFSLLKVEVQLQRFCDSSKHINFLKCVVPAP